MFLALAFQALIALRSPIIAKDGIAFIRAAKEVRTDFIAACRSEDQHPGYPALLLAGSRLARLWPDLDEFDVWIVGGRLAAGLCGVLAIVFLWLFARRLYDRQIADIAALLAAVWPLLRHNASDVLSDTPHLMFYLAAVWLSCEGLVRGRARWLAAAGVAGGLAFWVRPEGLLVPLVALVVMATARWRRQPRATPAGMTALALATLVVALPYVLSAGKFSSKKSFFNRLTAATEASAAIPTTDQPTSPTAPLVGTVAAPSPAPAMPLWAWKLPEAGLLAEPGPGATLPDERTRPPSTIGVLLFALVELGQEMAQGFYYLLLIPLAVGRFAPGRRPWQAAPGRMATAVLCAHAALLLALYHVAGYISHRHVIPLVALLLPMTGVGLLWIAERLAAAVTALRGLESPPGRWLRIAKRIAARAPWLARPRMAMAAVALVVAAGLLPKTLKSPHKVYRPVVDAARWVRTHSQPGDSVLSTSGYVRFYAERFGVVLGSEAGTLACGFAVAPHSGPWTFLVLEVNDLTLDREQLTLLDAAYEQVLDLAAHPRKTWLRVLVYRLKPAASPHPPKGNNDPLQGYTSRGRP
ncbi:MAG TPA: glycosyltransferase family 39 protein [Pirellulales bacterium]|nr:glycosyltransferase family 39 protein [Pirellulales bacterium]